MGLFLLFFLITRDEVGSQKCNSVPAVFGGKSDNQTCELQWETMQIELVMNEVAPLIAHVQVRGVHFKSYDDRRDGHFSWRKFPLW